MTETASQDRNKILITSQQIGSVNLCSRLQDGNNSITVRKLERYSPK